MSRYRDESINPLFFLGGLLAVIVIVVFTIGYQHQTKQTITICSKERAATSNGAEYRIYAAEGTFVMKDSLIGKVRYSTADAYARIKKDTTYDVVTKGWRIPFFSAFPNILEAKQATVQTPELCSDFG